MKKILISGGAGFIGCNFILYWNQKYPNDQLYCIDKLTYAGINYPYINDKCNFIHADIRFINHKKDIPTDFDYIIHLAAESHVDNSIANATEFVMTNVLGTYEMLKFGLKNKSLKKFIHISTDEVYGDNNKKSPIFRQDKEKMITHIDGICEIPFDENDRCEPSNPYSASKLAGDALILSYIRTFNLPGIILRPSNNYGFYQYEEKFLPKMIRLMMKKKPMTISGLLPTRDWLFVEDTCQAIDLIIQSGQIGEIYNIVGEDVHSIKEIAEKINELGGRLSKIEATYQRPGEDKHYLINGMKLNALGFQRTGNIMKMLPDLIDWYSSTYFKNKYGSYKGRNK